MVKMVTHIEARSFKILKLNSHLEKSSNFLGSLEIVIQQNCTYLPSGHSMSNRRRFDMDITSIPQRPIFDEFPRHFHLLVRCNFADRKIHVVSTYFFDLISMVEKSTLFPSTFSM